MPQDPGTHTQTVAQFPFASHVRGDTQEEVHDNKLVRATIVQPLIHGSGFPDRVEVHANGIGAWNNSTRDDVVSVQQRSCDGFSNTIDVNWKTKKGTLVEVRRLFEVEQNFTYQEEPR